MFDLCAADDEAGNDVFDAATGQSLSVQDLFPDSHDPSSSCPSPATLLSHGKYNVSG